MILALPIIFALLLVSPLSAISAEESNDGTSEVSKEDESSYPVVYAIKVVGARVTRPEMILREMRLKRGMRTTPESLESDRYHILSMGLFNHVEISVISDEGRAVVLVRLTERFYIYPYPIFRYDPAAPQRRIFGITLNHDNFRGFGERLTGGWWDGYEHGFLLVHRDPWFSYRGLYGLRTQIYVNNIELGDSAHSAAKVESYLIRLDRRIDRDRWIGVETEWEERSSSAAFYTLSSSGRDRLFDARLYYECDLRDYKYYPASGYYLIAVIKGNWMADTSHSFYRELFDLRSYKKAGPFILAVRASAQFTQKKLPYYRQAELTQLEIRSDEPLGLRGSRSFAANFEVRFNIIPKWYISLPDVPLAGPYLQRMKFSVEGLLFIDRGFLTVPEFDRDLSLTAYGCGFQIQMPYLETAHATIGWSKQNPLTKPAYVLETGVTF